MSAATVATTATATAAQTAAITTAAAAYFDGEGEVDARRLIHVRGMDDRWRRIDAIPLGSTLAHCLRMVHYSSRACLSVGGTERRALSRPACPGDG